MSFTILAEVEVLKVEDKGCLARFASGARPTISYKGLEVSGSSFASCAINLGDVEEAFPGDKLEIKNWNELDGYIMKKIASFKEPPNKSIKDAP